MYTVQPAFVCWSVFNSLVVTVKRSKIGLDCAVFYVPTNTV